MLRLWLAAQRRNGSANVDDTEARLQELCASEGWSADGSEGEEDEEEEMDNSEPLEDSDIALSDSGKLLNYIKHQEHVCHEVDTLTCLSPHAFQMKIWRAMTRWCLGGGKQEG